MFVTDVNGFTAVATEMTSDFVQSDEAWWRDAVRKGLTPAEAEFDESARQTVVSMAASIHEPGHDRPEGVIKIAFAIPTLDAALGRATSSETRLDILDGRGRLIASSSRNGARMNALPGGDQIPGAAGDTIVEFTAADTTRRGMVAAANNGSWRVVASMDERSVLEPLREARPMIAAMLIAVLSFLVLTLWSMSRFLDRRLSVPVTELAGVAEAVASGDLSTPVIPIRRQRRNRAIEPRDGRYGGRSPTGRLDIARCRPRDDGTCRGDHERQREHGCGSRGDGGHVG